jgi:hypothetical protein
MSYGLKVYDTSGNFSKLTVKIGKILESGSKTMPNSLNGDNTYGEDISLGSTYEKDEIGVIVYPTKFTFKASIVTVGDEGGTDDSYPFCWYADNNATYYTKNTTTGVMSSWSAGNLTPNSSGQWDGVASAFPLGSWDYLDSETTFSSVRIWAAMSHIVYDSSASAMKAVYTIGEDGVEEVQYIVFLRGT